MALTNFSLPFGALTQSAGVAGPWSPTVSPLHPIHHQLAANTNNLLYSPVDHQQQPEDGAAPPPGSDFYKNNPYAPPQQTSYQQFNSGRRKNTYLPPVTTTTTTTGSVQGGINFGLPKTNVEQPPPPPQAPAAQYGPANGKGTPSSAAAAAAPGDSTNDAYPDRPPGFTRVQAGQGSRTGVHAVLDYDLEEGEEEDYYDAEDQGEPVNKG
uniref:Uncharacterized protein n=1 Tax=Musca domestica TaxID=7370 RepID=A0A1I8MF95_MUSDO